MFKFKKCKKGFTLVEVIIAMVLISGTVAIFSKVAFSGLKAGNSNKESLQGTIIAQNYLEQIRAARDRKDILLDEYIDSLPKEEIKDNIKYSILVTSTEIEENEKGKLVEIIVEVKPQNGNSIEIGIRLLWQKNDKSLSR
ncbi:type IV pilus modification PilV family protein [Clostridium lundense]|uniref:type IV pilus modification PilV family protein n=1 Tax=Clostridium lundense TaxID=319475 RepID=UPI0004866240|nr:prepilin-type N-terminal cleavage/methylation domain-containing protein [Clostridium lundense]